MVLIVFRFEVKRITTLKIDSDDEYWSEEEQATIKLQENLIFQSISEYTSKQFYKTLVELHL